MRIEGSNSAMTNLKNAPRVSGGRATPAGEVPKGIGETPPRIVPLSQIGELAALFARGGTVSKLKRRLNKLKGKNCRVTPAKGTIACVDANDLVYLGVDFLKEYQDNEDVIAGVMAHEWGHTCASKPTEEELKNLNWNQIFELRRAHEVLADEICGRLLAMMDYDIDRFIAFLTRKTGGTHTLKYHDSNVRANIVRYGFEDEKKKINLAREIFPTTSGYRNFYQFKLIDDDV